LRARSRASTRRNSAIISLEDERRTHRQNKTLGFDEILLREQSNRQPNLKTC